jgi:hypothetical protein
MDSKVSNNTFKVYYNDGEEIIVKPVSWKQLEDVEKLCQEIFIQLVEVDGSCGQLFRASNRKFWSNAEKLAAMLPVVGQEQPGIELDKIDEIDQLTRIFITVSDKRHPETGGIYSPPGEQLPPSEIYRINSLDFFLALNQAQKTFQKRTLRKTKNSK